MMGSDEPIRFKKRILICGKVKKMRDEMQYDIEKTRKSVSIEKLQDDMEKLQDDVRRLEIQVAALSNVNIGQIISDVEAGEPPHAAIGKFQMCKSCKHMRYPHKSNAHYTCDVRHATIEPTWTCGRYNDKKNQRIVEPVAYCGH